MKVDALLAIAVANHGLSTRVAAHGSALQPFLFPVNVDFKSTLRAQAFHRSSGPGRGQCGQQLDLAVVALQQQFDNGRGAAKIAVDLKRRSAVEEIRIGMLGLQQGRENLVRMLGVV